MYSQPAAFWSNPCYSSSDEEKEEARYRITHQTQIKQRVNGQPRQQQWEKEDWTWEEILDGKGPWAEPVECRRPKAELEAAKAERRRYEEAARKQGWRPNCPSAQRRLNCPSAQRRLNCPSAQRHLNCPSAQRRLNCPSAQRRLNCPSAMSLQSCPSAMSLQSRPSAKSLQSLPPDRISQSLPPDRISQSLPPDRISQSLPPDRISQSLPPDRISQSLPPDRIMDHPDDFDEDTVHSADGYMTRLASFEFGFQLSAF
ncbi:uncharacterized protein ACWYII_012053 [Salvelinus alpinus]